MVKNILAFFVMIICISIPAFGSEMVEPNRVNFQLQSEQWVSTTTAEVTVVVDATLDKFGLSQARTQILAKLAALAKDADWHITVFDRMQNQSGLEQLRVEAQTRLPEKDLSNLRDKAKEISKPGLTFSIQNISFTPSLNEFEKARTDLRSLIYAEAQTEVARLNKAFPNQNYSVHAVNFQEGMVIQPVNSRMQFAAMAGGAPAPYANKTEMLPLTVSTKIQMVAVVELDSNSVK